jgi:hypothetical protein
LVALCSRHQVTNTVAAKAQKPSIPALISFALVLSSVLENQCKN